jgi:hypothetical protein
VTKPIASSIEGLDIETSRPDSIKVCRTEFLLPEAPLAAAFLAS